MKSRVMLHTLMLRTLSPTPLPRGEGQSLSVIDLSSPLHLWGRGWGGGAQLGGAQLDSAADQFVGEGVGVEDFAEDF